MNKTININLAGMFFHIDEEAYFKLHKYLETIKRSFTNSQGRDEIIADIEARIAELFSERIVNERQVISSTDVNHVISVMGQPEDYMVNEEIFDDEPEYTQKNAQGSRKQLLRDPDNKYIAGVSSGLSYYLGIDAVWVRLIWIILMFVSAFTIVLVYIIFWIVMPEAKTTAQKLSMKGEPVNISNIEKKIKEGFDDVADHVKNVDYEKMGRKVKAGSQTFFESIGNVILSILKVFGKFVGILLVIISTCTLIAMLILLFTLGSSSFIKVPVIEQLHTFFLTGTPLWIFSIFTFFAVGVPIFLLFILGLKILVSNPKSISNVTKYTLLAVWIVSILGLIFFGLKKASESSTKSTITHSKTLNLTEYDPLTITIPQEEIFDEVFNSNGITFVESNGEKLAKINHIKINIRATRDSIAYVKVEKQSTGADLEEARNLAADIQYSYTLNNNHLKLNDYLLTVFENGYQEQRVYVTVYVPEGIQVVIDESTKYLLYDVPNDHDISDREMYEHTWMMGTTELECGDCATETEEVPADEEPTTETEESTSTTNTNENKESLVIEFKK